MKAETRPFWSIGVVVPARNEEGCIESCIDSIRESCLNAAIEEYWIVVVADSCTDLTVSRAGRALGPCGEVIECEVRSAGSARRAGVEAALAHFAHRHPARIWLANTDADTVVPRDWIKMQLRLADSGVAGVAGIVRLAEGGSTAVHDMFLATYATSPDGTHGHVHGANLALRADAYLDAGGWSHRVLAEDHCLWDRLKRRGWRVASTVSSVVITSARLVGRARGGFADTLRAGIDARQS